MSRFHKDTDGFRSVTRYKSSPPTLPSQAPECPVALCCFHRPVFKVTRVIDGEELRIRLWAWTHRKKCIEEATARLRELAGGVTADP